MPGPQTLGTAMPPTADPPARRLLRHAALLPVLLVAAVLLGTGSRSTAPAAVLGLLTAGTVYLTVLRWGVWHWLAALACLPGLLSPLLTATARHPTLAGGLGLLAGVGIAAVSWRLDPSARSVGVAGAVLVVLGIGWGVGWWSGAGPPSRPVGEAAGAGAGVLLLCCLALAVGGALGLGRARGSGLRVVAATVAGVPAAALLLTAAPDGLAGTGRLLALVWWPAAGTLGLTAMLRGRRGPTARRPQADRHDLAAVEDYRRRYADPSLAEVVVVIAAWNEADALPRVLDELPSTVCGLATDVLVVDDGSTDGTAAAVAAHERARIVVSPVNRGQGAALRLGYRVARGHGARYLITTDADGQYDPADLPAVLDPLLDGTADFVTGSRRLGHQEVRDRVRRLGVHVFAWAVSALTGHWCTDTSFGLRAMRAELTEDVTLNQPQYQSSELLIGALSHGWRVAEVPARMRVRSAGTSKKGPNLVYGSRYARVVVGTWWREGAPTPPAERAPALRDPVRGVPGPTQ